MIVGNLLKSSVLNEISVLFYSELINIDNPSHFSLFPICFSTLFFDQYGVNSPRVFSLKPNLILMGSLNNLSAHKKSLFTSKNKLVFEDLKPKFASVNLCTLPLLFFESVSFSNDPK